MIITKTPRVEFKATIVWDDMITVVENDVEISRVYVDNRINPWLPYNVSVKGVNECKLKCGLLCD